MLRNDSESSEEDSVQSDGTFRGCTTPQSISFHSESFAKLYKLLQNESIALGVGVTPEMNRLEQGSFSELSVSVLQNFMFVDNERTRE